MKNKGKQKEFTPPTNFNSYSIAGVYNLKTGESGFRVVGIWGVESRGEGNRIGPVFSDDDIDKCSELIDELTKLYGLPVSIATIISHFTGIKVGQKVNTTDGIGVVLEIRPGPFPFFVRLENGGTAWQDMYHIISKID